MHYAARIVDRPPPEQPSDLDDRPRRAPGIEANEANGRVLLVRPADGGYYLLDELGALVWELCDASRPLGQVIAAVGARLDRPPTAVAGDVREWIAELRTERLLLEPA